MTVDLTKGPDRRQAPRRNQIDRRIQAKRYWYCHRGFLAYLALSAALFFAVYRGEDARHDFQTASIQSGTAVATVGCNRDFRTNQRLRSILERGSASADRQLENGDLTQKNYDDLKAIYEQQIKVIPLPDCRNLKISADPNRALIIPTPLFEGSKWENKPLPGERFGLPPEAPTRP